MRTLDDIVEVRMQLSASVSLDWERIESDPAWLEASMAFDLTDPEQKKEALYRYLGWYVSRELLFTSCPATNGPGEPRVISMEEYQNVCCGGGARTESGGAANT